MPDRRRFVRSTAVGGAALRLGARPRRADAEPPLETTSIRIGPSPSLCAAPQFVAEELLRAEKGEPEAAYRRRHRLALLNELRKELKA